MIIKVSDLMQPDYEYELTAKEGDLPAHFNPNVTPKQMLELGVFGGKYMCDCEAEFPEWFENAKLSPEGANADVNYFKSLASTSLAFWLEKGWIVDHDPRGWFQWYCRYYKGRRLPKVWDEYDGENGYFYDYDAWQIRRWRNAKRHVTAILKKCDDLSDHSVSPRQRQAALHWGILVNDESQRDTILDIFKD